MLLLVTYNTYWKPDIGSVPKRSTGLLQYARGDEYYVLETNQVVVSQSLVWYEPRMTADRVAIDHARIIGPRLVRIA